MICDYVHSHLRHGVYTLNSGGRRGRNISTSTHILLNDVISVEHSLMFTLIPDLLNSYIPLSVISIKSSSHSLFCKSYEFHIIWSVVDIVSEDNIRCSSC